MSPTQKVFSNVYLLERVFDFLPLRDKLVLSNFNETWKTAAEESLKKETRLLIGNPHPQYRRNRKKDNLVNIALPYDNCPSSISVPILQRIYRGRSIYRPQKQVPLRHDLAMEWTEVLSKLPNVTDVIFVGDGIPFPLIDDILEQVMLSLAVQKLTVEHGCVIQSWSQESQSLEQMHLDLIDESTVTTIIRKCPNIKYFSIRYHKGETENNSDVYDSDSDDDEDANQNQNDDDCLRNLPAGLRSYHSGAISHHRLRRISTSPAAATLKQLGRLHMDINSLPNDGLSSNFTVLKSIDMELHIIQTEVKDHMLHRFSTFMSSFSNLVSLDLTIRNMNEHYSFESSCMERFLDSLGPSIVNNKLKSLTIISSDYSKGILNRLQASEHLEKLYWVVTIPYHRGDSSILEDIACFLEQCSLNKLSSVEIRFPTRVIVPEPKPGWIEEMRKRQKNTKITTSSWQGSPIILRSLTGDVYSIQKLEWQRVN